MASIQAARSFSALASSRSRSSCRRCACFAARAAAPWLQQGVMGNFRGSCRSVSLGVDTLDAPKYAKVSNLEEDSNMVWSDMPDLALSGPKETDSRASSSVAGIMMDTAIPGVGVHAGEAQTASKVSGSVTTPETRFGELPNGVRLAVVDRQGMCASVGLFVHAGSRYESAENACIPHALELMAFRSSAHLSHLRTLKTLEQLGAAASCRVGREDILYQFDALREYVPVVLPLMLANVLCPSVLEEEILAARDTAKELRLGLEDNVEGLLCELLHVAAYKGNTLGNPLYAEEEDLPKISVESIREFIKRECRPDNMIIVGVNVDFDDLCKWTARSFAEVSNSGNLLPTSPPAPVARKIESAVYHGGDYRMARPNPLCHLMLGWEVDGGWNGQMLAAVTVLQMFLGGGGSFSTGGPGKGMHTRLYTEVLNRHHWVESCQASSMMYADSGLFTVYATVVPQHAEDFVKVIARIFKGLTRITPEELTRAKNALKSSIHMNLEMRSVVMEDIGRQLVLSGKVGTAQEFGKIVDGVTAQDLVDTLRKCLKTEPTLVAYGAIEKVPSHENVKKLIQAGIP